MSRYSNDLRVLAINMLNSQKKSFEEVSKIINVCTKTLRSWFHKDNSGTLFDILPSTGRCRVYDYDGLKTFVDQYPDKTLYEIKDEFFTGKASISGIDKALKAMDFRLKKKSNYTKKLTMKKDNNMLPSSKN